MTSRLIIFTPTYNRAYLLSNLYISLSLQECNDFTWLIVDDGSTDSTKNYVEKWKSEGNIDIQYYYQDNAGKHVAFNTGVEKATGEWFFCVDSDDTLTTRAVLVLQKLIDEESKSDIIGFYSPRGTVECESTILSWPKEKYLHLYDPYEKYSYSGETAIILRTDLLKKYPLPTNQSEKFVPENVLYRKINNIGTLRSISEIIYLSEYQPDGYTKAGTKLLINNPWGAMQSYAVEATYAKSMLNRAKAMGKYLSWKKILFSEGISPEPKVPFIVYIGGYLLQPHYIRIIKKIMKEA